MAELGERISALSPERRALLLRRLASRGAEDSGSTIPVQPRDRYPCRFPASAGQQRLWFLHELDRHSTAYVLPIVLRLRGALDVPALIRSIPWLIDRHEALRTSYDVDAAGAVEQVVHAPGAIRPTVEVSEVAAADTAGLVSALVARPFDLRTAPPLHATVLRVVDAPGPEHVLVLCVHHVSIDGWSLGILVKDLQTAYAAHAAGAEPGVAPLALQYADVSVWQEQESGRGDGDLAFWRDRLSGVAPLRLPVDRPAQAIRSTRGDTVEVRIPAAVAARLAALAAAERCTEFMVLAATFAAVLGRWTDQEDVLLVTPVAGRPDAVSEGVVGFFVNTLPLRFRVRPERRFRELLSHVRAVSVEAYEHQDVAFDRIVRELGDRQAGHTPLGQVMVALRNVRLEQLELPGVATTVLDVPSGGAQLDLGIEFAPTPDGDLVGALEFATDLFDRASALRIAEALRAALAAVVDDPDRPVWQIPVTEGGTPTPDPRRDQPAAPDGVVRWFESVVDRVGDAVAVTVDDTGATCTYRELDERANRLAHHLVAAGVAREDRVGVVLDRGLELVVALLAVLKAGAVYVPLDPTYPRARLAALVHDAAPVMMLTATAHAGVAQAVAPAVDRLVLDAPVEEPSALPADLPSGRRPDAPAGAAAAYLFFTSGSTGRPKGVLGTHRGIANRVADMSRLLTAEPGERVLQRTPVGFDPSLSEMLAPLVSGAEIVVATPERHADSGYLLDAVARHAVTSMDVVPSLLRLIVERPDLTARTASLRRLFCGGEELPAALATELLAAVPGVRLLNAYGPTEAAVDVSSHHVTAPVPERIPIGTPLPGVELLVLDRHAQRQPVGVPGNLLIGGVQLARGYLDAPGLTAERFLPHPFDPGARVYDTGDRARWLPDGSLQFLGRSDSQLKIRGVRIEPGEVEAVLRGHPAVADAAVLARGAGVTAQLVAYLLVGDTGARTDVGRIREFLRERLPAGMVPTALHWLDAFPLTSSGKLDRAALPDLGAVVPADRVPPDGELETVLAGLWADVLERPEVGALDDFFELGGHSLLATRLVARTGDLFRVELSLRAFVESSTVRDLAGLVRRGVAEAGQDADQIAAIILAVSAMPAAEVADGLRAAAGE